MKYSNLRFIVSRFNAIVAALAFVLPAFAQDDLASKPFQQWTKNEANKILSDSPWAKTQESRVEAAKQKRAIAGGINPKSTAEQESNRVELGSANAPIDFIFTLRLRSALPVRQALLRLKQIEAKYDRMSDAERAAFDAKNKGLLECPACAQNYVITISSKSKNYPGADAVYELLRLASLESIKNYIYIANDKGERREVVHFVPPKSGGDEATFFFPRFDDEDRPLITARDKKLLFRLADRNPASAVNFEFDVSKLLLNGEVAF